MRCQVCPGWLISSSHKKQNTSHRQGREVRSRGTTLIPAVAHNLGYARAGSCVPITVATALLRNGESRHRRCYYSVPPNVRSSLRPVKPLAITSVFSHPPQPRPAVPPLHRWTRPTPRWLGPAVLS